MNASTNRKPSWWGGFQNLEREHGFEPLAVEGTIPEGLVGTFYRNGPGLLERFGQRSRHWFDTVAAVCAVRIGPSGCEGAVKLLRTAGFEREERAGERLFGGWDTPHARPMREMLLGDVDNPAGTSVMLHRGRLLALCEGGQPLRLDDDLESGARSGLDGLVTHGFSAHPHRVVSREATYNFGIELGRRTVVRLYEMDDAGGQRELTSFAVDRPLLNHDFAVTDRHAVFLLAPFRIRMLPLLFRGKSVMEAVEWLDQPAELVVIPLDDPSRHLRIDIAPQLLEHVVNAYERAGEIVLDYTRYPDVASRERYLSGLVRGEVAAPLGASVGRLSIDPRKRSVRESTLFDEAFELPTVAPADAASPYRHAYAVGFSTEEAARSSMFDCVARLDVERGEVRRHVGTPAQFFGEPLFVPTPPGSGYVLTFVYDADAGRSHVAILDAAHLEDEPVARVLLGQAIPFGFHGLWKAHGGV
jgi:all-trans-8'-apo-beta-carotenal 15,15'-oxygenase